MKIKVEIGATILETNDVDLAIMAINNYKTAQQESRQIGNLKPKGKGFRWSVNAMQVLTENLHLTPTELKKLPELSKFSTQKIGQKKYSITSKK